METSYLQSNIYDEDPSRRILDTQYGITVGIHQKHRAGKTLTAIMLIIYYLLHRKDIKGVISNVTLDLSSIGMQDKFVPLRDIKIIKREEYKNYIIFTDEFRRLCDSRMSTSFKNLFVSNLLADTGKFKQIHILTDQDAAAIDKRVRGNADCVLHPTYDKNTGMCNVKMFDTYRDYYWISSNGMVHDWKVEFDFEAQPYFKYYRTEQKIDEFILTFTPDEYYQQLDKWLHKEKMVMHPDFELNYNTLLLWKEMEGIYITAQQLRALMEWLKYNSDYKIKKVGRKKRKVEES